MNHFFTRLPALGALLLLLVSGTSYAQKGNSKTKQPITTVYIIRHAEKDTTVAGNPDPDLSAAGRLRAQALSQTLAKRPPAALFTTDTKRTRATLAPLAAAIKVEPQTYDPKRGRDLADRVLKEYAGKSVVVVGHSNTVLSLIDDFGGVPPVDEIRDDEYEYLFVVYVAPGVQPVVETRGYGAERRETPADRLEREKSRILRMQTRNQAKTQTKAQK